MPLHAPVLVRLDQPKNVTLESPVSPIQLVVRMSPNHLPSQVHFTVVAHLTMHPRCVLFLAPTVHLKFVLRIKPVLPTLHVKTRSPSSVE